MSSPIGWTSIFAFRGRMRRADYKWAAVLVLSTFTALFIALNATFGWASTWILYPPTYWALAAASIARFHDLNRSGWKLCWLAIPILGPLWVGWSLLAKRGRRVTNRYGPSPDGNLDYFTVPSGEGEHARVVRDVIGIEPVEVREILRPTTVEEIQRAIGTSTGPISIGGGRFSMGGQTASAGSLHLDMRGLNRVVGFSREEKWIRVQAGARWCDLQRYLDPHDLSVSIMQTYANFTVGGALSVNSHGRYVGLGPAILSVRSIDLVLADGRRVTASPTENPELFYGAIGGYGGLGVIVEAELKVVDNCRVAGEFVKLPLENYWDHFTRHIRGRRDAVFHNADIYPPHYAHVRAQTWVTTDKPLTERDRLMPLRAKFPHERYLMWAISSMPWGKWRREYVLDPVLTFRRHVRWRNYEAGYDVAELGVAPTKITRYLLQEYFIARERAPEFVPKMAEILRRFDVNVINVSIRHAIADPGSMLAWAREECFAFVIYYKQGVAAHDRARVAVWTRRLIDAALELGGTYYLPYQAHGSSAQFHQAYPRARDYFTLKQRVDPDFRFRNVLWNQYYAPSREEARVSAPVHPSSEFRAVYGDPAWSDRFYAFLQNIYHLYPEDRFHALNQQASQTFDNDKAIYQHVQAELPKIKPFLAPLTHGLPALKKQKRVMSEQTLRLLGTRRTCNGYVEIGSTGRYISELQKHVQFSGPIWITNDVAPSKTLGDLMERGGFKQYGTFLPLDYRPLDSKGIAPESIDLVTSFIGLHHAPAELLDGFVRSIHRVLRPGGLFIVRDHDANSPEMEVFCSLVHTVFNLGFNVPWDTNEKEFKSFKSADAWSAYLAERGFHGTGQRLLQDRDPSANTLMAFARTEKGEAR